MNRKVYSSEGGRLCPACGEPTADCRCADAAATASAASGPAGGGPASGGGRVRVGRETKGRRGKAVTVVSGLPLDAFALADLARELKTRCGAGGKVRDGVIEIQGDHRDTLVAELQARGYDAKRAGG